MTCSAQRHVTRRPGDPQHRSGPVQGRFRPPEDGDPDHYSERYTGTSDNGGVHSNSGIPNHAYYLLINGGKNAGEARGHNHTGPTVTGIGLADAQQIFYTAFTGLPSTATMLQARQATESVASGLYGASSQQRASTSAAWEAVGVR
ncbi:MAG: peptidase M4 family protein [Actinomycetota bacterium]|nr:peptidase M4 family protein [Actinomycetota bacterium]MDP9477392.1 peptidase M4 family protein [Actinomycetota bacterium]